MPLRLIRKLASRILGRPTVSKSPERKPAPDRPRRGAPPGRGTPRPTVARERPQPAAERTPDRRGATADGGRPPQPRRQEPRDDRRDRPPRRDHAAPHPAGRLAQVHTPQGQTRPGGLVSDEESQRRQAAHAVWDPASFQVPPVEGKKRFPDFDLPPEILHAIADLGFQYCTPIQALSLDHALAGRNVAGRAQTGTGKTAAFLIALLTRYLRHPAGRPARAATPRALVIAPTRELVIQICHDADNVGKYCGLRYLAVYGGMDHERQRRELAAGPVDLLVATPGRLLDYVQSRTVDLSQVDTLVIDEADRMLDMGFIPDVRRIVGRLPPPDRRCTMLYSATLDTQSCAWPRSG